jgi:thioredoxin reductase (NADPH)
MLKTMDYDIIIIGAGPAGICAAIYALRANQKTLIIEKETIGGKIASSPLIENYPGIKAIKGPELSEQLEDQIKQLGGKLEFGEVMDIQHKGKEKIVITKNKTHKAKAIILALGTKYKKLGLPEEEKFLGKGISFCATCDGFFYRQKTVAVIGGGNSAMANALELANICQKVYVIQNLDHLTAELMLIDQIKPKENIEIITQASVKQIQGEEKVTGIVIEEKGKEKRLTLDGMFLSIGQIPETEIVSHLVKRDENGYIVTNEQQMTNSEGIFAAGDCVKKNIRQLTTAVSDGTIAALSAIEYNTK